ncbi:MAG: hypothetical protein JWO03_825, partial [Bacteroidetes bacterium]|nr:hypothetical protein [Bacteroidota bacterium]
MRKIYFLLFTICLFQFCRAQHVGLYGNEWVDYTPGHQYWKIKVKTDGFYHLPYTTLNNNIANLSSINPNDLVLYHNGQKVYIDVHTTAGVFDTASY